MRLMRSVATPAEIRTVVELELRDDHLIIRPTMHPRSGWDDAFRRLREYGDDALLDEEAVSATEWDTTEWEW